MRSILIISIFLSSLSFQAQQNQTAPPMVLVTGEGIVNVVPDQVLIRSRIEHEGSNPQEIKKQNDAVVDRVIKYLKSQGIPEKNIRTDFVNLNKNYDYNTKTYSYAANQSISIQLDDLKNYEKIMSGLLEQGLNRIDGIQFLSSQIKKHTAEARRLAVLNAKSKATEYVAPLDQSIGKAISISEVETNQFVPVYRQEMMKVSDSSESQETIAPGEMEVKARVTIGFQLK